MLDPFLCVFSLRRDAFNSGLHACLVPLNVWLSSLQLILTTTIMFMFRLTYSLFLHHLQESTMQNMNIEKTHTYILK